jgi:hypothetical protein
MNKTERKRKDVQNLLKLTPAAISAMEQTEYMETLEDVIRAIERDSYTGKDGIPGGIAKKLRGILKLFEGHQQETDIGGGVMEARRQDWEINHIRIKAFIRNYLIENRSMPTVTIIARDLNISRVTVYEHLGEGIRGEFYAEKLKEMEYMTLDILQLLYLKLIDGNVIAGKIWLDYMAKMQQGAGNVRQQNNYLQVNSITLNEEQVKQLPEPAQQKISSLTAQLREIISEYQ